MVFTLADVLEAKIRIVLWGTLIISSGGRVLETINVDQRVGRLVPPADKRLLKQTVNPPFPPLPLFPSSIPPFLPLLEPPVLQPSGSLAPKAKMHPLHWSGACILFCTANCTALSKYASCIVQNYTSAQRSATPVQAQCTNRQLGFTQILSLLQNEHCNGNGWARSCEGPSATFSEEADCTAVQPYHHQSNCSANGAECMHCCDSDLLMHTIFFGSFCAFAMSVCFILHVLVICGFD